jgi:hypothetical protein
MRFGIVDLIGGRGRHHPICMDDPLSQLCRMRDEILKLVTERLAPEARCGVGQIKLQERFAERLLYDCRRSTLSRHRTPHPSDSLHAELTTFDADMLSACRRPDIEMQMENIVTVNGIHTTQMSQTSN